jgi:hypothetical protein
MMNASAKSLSLILFLSAIASAEDDAPEFLHTYELISSAWEKKDGSMSDIIYNSLVELMIIEPCETMGWLKNRKDIYSGFTAHKKKIFTAYVKEDEENVRKKKEKLSKALTEARCDDKGIESEKNKLLKKIRDTAIREID